MGGNSLPILAEMPPAHRPPDSAGPARGAGTELWLVRPGPARELERRLAAFAGTELFLVLSPPSGEEADWAAAFAHAARAPHRCLEELRSGPDRDGERAWPPVEQALGGGHARILAVVGLDVLGVLVGRALSIPPERRGALRVDPGRCVLLRDDPIGLVLRRSNVAAPRIGSGTALPGGGGQ